MIRFAVIGAILIASVMTASAFGLGQQSLFGKMGAMSKSASAPPPVGCVSPTAPNGQVDLSQCSNAFYAAVIF